MDVFVEQIIRRKLNGKDFAISIGISLAGAIVLFLCLTFGMTYLGAMAFLLMIGAVYGVYWVIMSRNLEFEYSVTNGDLTIDKIVNRKKRKRIISFDVKNAEEIGKYDETRLQHKNFEKKYFTGVHEDGRDSWYITCRSAKTGYVLVVFDPEERVLEAIKPFLPRQLRFEVFGRK